MLDPFKKPLWLILRSISGTVLILGCVGIVTGLILAVTHPDSPLPDEWNPLDPLIVSAPETPLTIWKLRRALADPEDCVAALGAHAEVIPRVPFEVSESCHIRNRVEVSAIGQAGIDPIETTCATALRTAMWEHHSLQPRAREILGAKVAFIRQIGSYNCRAIRTPQGGAARWSTHATGDAIDITGFDLEDGRTVRLIRDWGPAQPESDFLRAVRDDACKWFATTLSPDFNALHADHFHLQARGWGTCR